MTSGMSRSTLLAVFMIALVLPLTSCADRWRVVRQGEASAFATDLAIAPPSFEGIVIDGMSEAEHQAELVDDEGELWQEAKAAFAATFTSALSERMRSRSFELGTEPFGKPTVLARVESVVVAEPFTVDHNPNYLLSSVRVAIVLSDASGSVVDEISIEHSAHTYASRPAAERFTTIAKVLADITSEYLEGRLKEAKAK